MGSPSLSIPTPGSFYFNYFTLETNLSKPGYLNHTAQVPTQAERCGAWWPVISALGMLRQVDCPGVYGQSGLQSETLSQEYKTTPPRTPPSNKYKWSYTLVPPPT